MRQADADARAEELGKQLAALQEAAHDALAETDFRKLPGGKYQVLLNERISQAAGHHKLRKVFADTAEAAAPKTEATP